MRSSLARAAAALGLIRAAGDAPVPDTVTARRQQQATDGPLSLDAVYRAVQVLQVGAGQLTIDVWRGDRRIDTPSWISQPDPWEPMAVAHITQTVESLAMRGNAFWRVRRGTDGQPVGLEVLDPLSVSIRVPDHGPYLYIHDGAEWGPRDILHLAIRRQAGRRYPYGRGPIQQCRESITGAIAARRVADTWTTEGTVPNGTLSTPQQLTNAEVATIKQSFLGSVRTGEPIVLSNGATYEHISLTPSEMQWLETQNFNILAVARLFGIPSRLMLIGVEGLSNTYANQQQEDLAFVRWTLIEYLHEIEAAYTWLLPRGQSARFNVDAILRADTKTRYEAHQIGINAGFLTIDEVRATEGLNPLPTTSQEPANA